MLAHFSWNHKWLKREGGREREREREKEKEKEKEERRSALSPLHREKITCVRLEGKILS